MKFIVSLLIGFNTLHSLAQDSLVLQEFPDVEASFCSEGIGYPGGKTALDGYLQTNLNFNGVSLHQNTVIYTCFTVTENGRITNVLIENITNPKIMREIERVLYGMPLWSTSYRNGKPAEYQVRIPIKIVLEVPVSHVMKQQKKPF